MTCFFLNPQMLLLFIRAPTVTTCVPPAVFSCSLEGLGIVKRASGILSRCVPKVWICNGWLWMISVTFFVVWTGILKLPFFIWNDFEILNTIYHECWTLYITHKRCMFNTRRTFPISKGGTNAVFHSGQKLQIRNFIKIKCIQTHGKCAKNVCLYTVSLWSVAAVKSMVSSALLIKERTCTSEHFQD